MQSIQVLETCALAALLIYISAETTPVMPDCEMLYGNIRSHVSSQNAVRIKYGMGFLRIVYSALRLLQTF